jgi:hypothetical protein
MMEFHVLTPAGPELLMYVVDGELVIVPAPGAQEPNQHPDPAQE